MKHLAIAMILVVFSASCSGDDNRTIPWQDVNEESDSGGDVAKDVLDVQVDIFGDTFTDVTRDLPLDAIKDHGHDTVKDSWTDLVVGPDLIDKDTTPHDTGRDFGHDDSTWTDADDDTADLPAPPDADPDSQIDSATPTDVSGDAIFCERDADCTGLGLLTPCEKAVCIEGFCQIEALPNGTTCNDGTYCTIGDKCLAGECVGTTILCDDGDPCTMDTCSPATGCVHESFTGPCDDEDECTVNDSCINGSCYGSPVVCDDENDCTNDSCNTGLGCLYTNLTGPSCNDENSCTTTDRCIQGLCVGRDTCNDGNDCTGDLCDPITGCSHVQRDGECSDGRMCTTGDSCVEGQCVGMAMACSDDNSCTSDSCQEGVGCVFVANADACDDGDPCTQDDICANSDCAGTPNPCNTPPAKSCTEDNLSVVTYDKQGSCTNGTCIYHSQIVTCSYGCENNACIGDPCAGVDCTVAPSPCFLAPGVCDDGSCVYAFNDGGACSDENPCTSGETCLSGSCRGGTVTNCDDAEPCTIDSCATGEEGGCVHTVIEGPCADGDACTENDLCILGVCTSGSDVDCNDDNVCTIDSCDSVVGCVHQNDDWASCDDDDACTTGDSCSSGMCGGKKVLCKTPPDNECRDENTLLTWDGTGTCSGGVCSYVEHEVTCGFGCRDGSCVGDPCIGIVCDSPPNACYKTAGACSSGVCQYEYDNGLECDDSNVCTTGETCSNGICSEGSDTDCDDDESCTNDTCIDFWGCWNTAVVNGTPCDDGNPCTTGDSCRSGTCRAGYGTLDCNDHNSCTSEVCDPDDACVYTVLDGQACDDGDACTTGDVCAEDLCTTTPIACNTPPASTCSADGTQAISYNQQGDCIGGACQYNSQITTCLGGCDDGLCLGDPCAGVVCDNPPNQCYKDAGTCLNGSCYFDYDNGASCDDGNLCTVGETCWYGTCRGVGALDCDDENGCTSDSCDPVQGCEYAQLSGVGCSDGNTCTVDDMCVEGLCQGAGERTCDDGKQCTDDSCDPETGCVFTTDFTNTCDDGNACTNNDSCATGKCAGVAITCATPPDSECLEDGISLRIFDPQGTCSAGVCAYAQRVIVCEFGCEDSMCVGDPCAGMTCVTPPNECYVPTGICLNGVCRYAPDDTAVCDDLNPCTTGESCDGGVCDGETETDCDDGDPCSDDSCVPASGCVNTPVSGPCEDGDACTVGDECVDGTCISGSLSSCNDDETCTTDSCNPASGCVFTADEGSACDDNDACTASDTCSVDGTCEGTPVICNTPLAAYCVTEDDILINFDALGSCSSGVCNYTRHEIGCAHGCLNGRCLGDPCVGVTCTTPPNDCYLATGSCEDGACVYTPDDGKTCTDNSACTEGEHCQGGVCVGGTELDCDDERECTVDSCEADWGCKNIAVLNGTPCDDGNPCSTGDFCRNKNCLSGYGALDCDDDNECTVDDCDPEVEDGCTHVALADGTSCSDNNNCTDDDVCESGVCVGSGIDCNDHNSCTNDLCNDPAVGCFYEYNTASCNDGNPCTDGDTCSMGSCSPGGPKNCDDGIFCTTDDCDPAVEGGCTHDNNNLLCGEPSCSGNNFSPARYCLMGACPAVSFQSCRDDVDCTTDSCDVGFGCINNANDALCADDENPCTDQRCHPENGCETINNTADCDDGNPCTFPDRCWAGVCSGENHDCDDHLTCTDDSCDGTGGCNHLVQTGFCAIDDLCLVDGDISPANQCLQCVPEQTNIQWSLLDGIFCDDGSTCTTDDQCVNGVCTGDQTSCDDDDPCTDDYCSDTEGCIHEYNDAPCDDLNTCTTGDACVEGVCTGGAPINCNDDNSCTGDSCNPVDGCTHENLDISCDDGDECTLMDHCVDGDCVGGGENDCQDFNDCTNDTCVTGEGCVNTPVANGTMCSDDNDCTEDDSCNNGHCYGVGEVCEDENPCTDDLCESPETGCHYEPNNLPCDDQNACTQTDQCSNKVCVGTDDLDCDDHDPCTDDRCDQVTGCQHTNNTAPCDDGSKCTLNDQCLDGSCVGGTGPNCNDDNICTYDYCDPLNGCVNRPLSIMCNDGDSCTKWDRCTNGACQGTTYSCDDTKACTTDSCDGTGDCSNILMDGWCIIGGTCIAEGTPNPSSACQICDPATNLYVWSSNEDNPCDDGDPCSYGDVCTDGICDGTSYTCNDNIACTADSCKGDHTCTFEVATGWCAIDGACVTSGTAHPDNVCLGCTTTNQTAWSNLDEKACDDDNACTDGDECRDGSCVPGSPRVCNDDNTCTDDSCSEELGGCVFRPNTTKCVTAHCVDKTYYHSAYCAEGLCPTPVTENCDDGEECTIDTCDASGCHYEFASGSCDDDNPCTFNDTCANGLCHGTVYTCTPGECKSSSQCDGTGACTESPQPDGTACTADANACTQDVCQAGACVHPDKIDGSSCNDANACTRTDTCLSGVCLGSDAVVCSPLNQCHSAGTCNPATGACSQPLLPEGTACNDSNLCTQTDQCLGGTCTGANPIVCLAMDQCHYAGSCYPLTGVCSNPTKLNGVTCDDDDLCTQNDTCQGGVCSGGSTVTCAPLDYCHLAGECDSETGLCSNPVVADGTACTNSNLCSVSDQCQSGVCVDGTMTVCMPLDQCHDIGTCNPVTGLCSNPSVANDTACDDANACTKNDLCTSGNCAGTRYYCDDYRACTADACDGVGGCIHDTIDGWCFIDNICRPDGQSNPNNVCLKCAADLDPAGWSDNDGASCNDNVQCTKNDICSGSACSGSAYDCEDHLTCTDDLCNGLGGCTNSIRNGFCKIDNACYAYGEANPFNACEKCMPSVSAIAWSAVTDGTNCDDGYDCSYGDICTGGVCAGQDYNCDDDRVCTTDSCDGWGNCQHDIVPSYCRIFGACWQVNNINPSNSCEVCAPDVANDAWTPTNEGLACDDGNMCTTDDVCGYGVCAGVGMSCDDTLVCTTDSCDHEGNCFNEVNDNWCLIDGVCYYAYQTNPFSACEYCDPITNNMWWTDADGTSCNDGDVCTVDDVCDGAVCEGAPMDCDDGIACTENNCAFGECVNSVTDGWCLIDGACLTDQTVSAENVCYKCNSAIYDTRWAPNNGATCDDGADCTHTDQCSAGICKGTSYSCTDGLGCTDDECNGSGNCDFPVVNGFCLIDGMCIASMEINPASPCEVCDPAQDNRDWTAASGTVCDDGESCTRDDTCQNGSCSGTTYTCDDELECTQIGCDGSGGCEAPVVIAGWCLIDGVCRPDQAQNPGNGCLICLSSVTQTAWTDNDGANCDDGQACTKLDTCLGGTCSGTDYACHDNVECTADNCDGLGGCLYPVVEGYCLIDGDCIADQTIDPDNLCRMCDHANADSNWTFRDGIDCDDNNPCTLGDTCGQGTCSGILKPCDDGLFCTVDPCDGNGGCNASYLGEGFCLIDGVCYDEGAPNPTGSCGACIPETATDTWTMLNTGAVEVCNHIDDNCDGITDPEDSVGCIFLYTDVDDDGVGTGEPRCLCEETGDIRTEINGDCDDNEPLAHPGGIEVCDGVDNDCDGMTDPSNTTGCKYYFYDFDGDGYGVDGMYECICDEGEIYRALQGGDCNDNDSENFPNNIEICDYKDNNCDNIVDSEDSDGCVEYYIDKDGDSYGQIATNRCLCGPLSPYVVTVGGDCNDSNLNVNPGMVEDCNAQDEDCSGTADDGDPYVMCPLNGGVTANGAPVCNLGTCMMACTPESGSTPGWYDLDAYYANGCECQSDAYQVAGGRTCADAVDLGSLNDDGSSLIRIANITTDGDDWWKVQAIDTNPTDEPSGGDHFNLSVVLLDNPDDEFVIDVRRGGCESTQTICSESTFVEWSTWLYENGVGENPCSANATPSCTAPADLAHCLDVEKDLLKCGSCPGYGSAGANVCADNSATFLIRVHRQISAPATCSTYTMKVINGETAWSRQ